MRFHVTDLPPPPGQAFQYWLHSMYLKVPLALPVNSSPGMVFPRREFPTNDAMLIYMAQLVHGAYQWKVKLNR